MSGGYTNCSIAFTLTKFTVNRHVSCTLIFSLVLKVQVLERYGSKRQGGLGLVPTKILAEYGKAYRRQGMGRIADMESVE